MTTEPDEDVKPPVVVMPDMLPSPNTPGSQYEQKTFLHGITLTQAAQQLTDRGTYSCTTLVLSTLDVQRDSCCYK